MGMDRKIKKKTWTTGRIIALAGGLAFLSFVLYSFLFADNRSKLNVDAEKITVSDVKRDVFQENIPETGIVMPSQTIYLDAVEGGGGQRHHPGVRRAGEEGGYHHDPGQL